MWETKYFILFRLRLESAHFFLKNSEFIISLVERVEVLSKSLYTGKTMYEGTRFLPATFSTAVLKQLCLCNGNGPLHEISWDFVAHTMYFLYDCEQLMSGNLDEILIRLRRLYERNMKTKGYMKFSNIMDGNCRQSGFSREANLPNLRYRQCNIRNYRHLYDTGKGYLKWPTLDGLCMVQ